MGEDIAKFGGVFGCSLGLPEEFPGRVLSTPISEAAFVGAGMGAAITGTHALVELQYVDFILCAMGAGKTAAKDIDEALQKA